MQLLILKNFGSPRQSQGGLFWFLTLAGKQPWTLDSGHAPDFRVNTALATLTVQIPNHAQYLHLCLIFRIIATFYSACDNLLSDELKMYFFILVYCVPYLLLVHFCCYSRSLEGFKSLVLDKSHCLNSPDVLICSVGTKIYMNNGTGQWVENERWLKRLDQGWNLDKVRETAYFILNAVGKDMMHFRFAEST